MKTYISRPRWRIPSVNRFCSECYCVFFRKWTHKSPIQAGNMATICKIIIYATIVQLSEYGNSGNYEA